VKLAASPKPIDGANVDREMPIAEHDARQHPQSDLSEEWRRFRRAYGEHRAIEGRRFSDDELLSLPFLSTGPLQREWSVRARTFQKFVRRVLEPRADAVEPRPLRVLDLGAGNGWLCYRVQLRGHLAVALDVRTDAVDGLAAAHSYRPHIPRMFGRVAASFEDVPLVSDAFDIVVFNAAIHYALSLDVVIREAARVTKSTGRIAILDSPFYARSESGEAMVVEKRRSSPTHFGERAKDLLGLPFIEYLTRDRLADASHHLGLRWRRHRVSYPLWYEMRSVRASVGRRRPPSRFDLWEATVP
jgi:SAM-dependent methyltransferase